MATLLIFLLAGCASMTIDRHYELPENCYTAQEDTVVCVNIPQYYYHTFEKSIIHYL